MLPAHVQFALLPLALSDLGRKAKVTAEEASVSITF